jgi:type II secretory pathway predicted ATPase ExeA
MMPANAMVLDYYKLLEQPFGVTPDPRFLFLSPTHQEALGSVLYGVSAGRGFTALIGKPGMGKTTLLFEFLNQVKDGGKTAYLFQPQYTPQDLLRSLLADIGIEEDGTDFVGMHRKLIDCLLEESKQGKQLVVVVDEAQNLDVPVLELLRMLSNFETPRQKLMHLILVGQPQLAEKLASPSLTQLRQRISIVARLEPLSVEETYQYIDHRLRVAGSGFAGPQFTKEAKHMIAEHAEGIPRNINNLCFNAMSLGCALQQRKIDVDVIKEVIGDLDLRKIYPQPDSNSPKDEASKPVVPDVSTPALLRTSRETWALRFALAVVLMVLIAGLFIRTSRPIDRVAASLAPSVPSRALTDTQIRAVAPSETSAASSLPPTPAANTLPVPKSSTIQVRSIPSAPAPPTAKASPAIGPRTVQVLPDHTLYRIIIENFGRYDEQTLAKIHELNPWLRDPRRIKAGQKVRIPETKDNPRGIFPKQEAVSSVSDAGVEKP